MGAFDVLPRAQLLEKLLGVLAVRLLGRVPFPLLHLPAASEARHQPRAQDSCQAGASEDTANVLMWRAHWAEGSAHTPPHASPRSRHGKDDSVAAPAAGV